MIMLRTSFAYSIALHILIALLLWVTAQSSLYSKLAEEPEPITAQIVSAKALASQIATAEKSHKLVPSKKSSPPPKKKVVIKPTIVSAPTTTKPQKKGQITAKPVITAIPPKAVRKTPTKNKPSLPTFTMQDRERFLQNALHEETDALRAMLHKEVVRIGHAIKRLVSANWLIPAGHSHDLSCQVSIHLDYSGRVQQVAIVRSSGNSSFDHAAMHAVRRSGPFPMPQDSRLLSQFHEVLLTLSPEGVT